MTRYGIALLSVCALGLVDCADSGEDGGSDPNSITVPLGMLISDQAIAAGTTQFTFVYDPIVNPVDFPLTDLTVDLAQTLESLVVTPVAPLRAQSAASAIAQSAGSEVIVNARVAPMADEATVCTTGEHYGPFIVSAESPSLPPDISPSLAEATQATLSVVNIGSFSVCLEVDSPSAFRVDIGEVTISPDECEALPENISGVWTGTFSCDNTNCGDNVDEPISLTITQAPSSLYSAHYEDDGGGVYDGTVCGREFRFNGGGANFIESGRFTLNSDGTGTKRSSFQNTDSSCFGSCVDMLTRP